MDFPYYTLAAIVGLQSIEQEEIERESGARVEIKERLFALIDHADEVMRGWEPDAEGVHTIDEVIADRASALLWDFVERADAARLVGWLDHASECVPNNSLCELVELLGVQEARRLVDEALASGKVSSSLILPDDLDDASPLWAYIPNLTQIYPAEQPSERR